MKKTLLALSLLFAVFFSPENIFAQLNITNSTTAAALAQKLVGEGVTISNVTFTGNLQMAGFFENKGNTNINLDSGILLTNGRARTTGGQWGVNSDGSKAASTVTADRSWGFNGDVDLSNAIGGSTADACVLEFDFVPLGDSIRFRYVFSSEEYTGEYVCSYNDAFAFFISGPGFTGKKNIALVPNTNIPVSIFNVNNIPDGTADDGGNCVNNPSYYVDNSTNRYFTHDGHTIVLTALAEVQPCQTYHLKLVIADAGLDDAYDSGVFLESGSLTSNAIVLTNNTQTDPATGLSYLVEGCVTGSVKISRPVATPFPQVVDLLYEGTAQNTIDFETLPNSITIPANQTDVFLLIKPVIDFIPEGIETLRILTLAPCASGPPRPTGITEIQIRDYDILGINPDTANICRNTSVQLNATSGYTTYTWQVDPTLSSTTARNPTATPVSGSSTYYCTANVGTCFARDSALVKWKDVDFISKRELNCKDASNGQIKVASGPEWAAPVQFAINDKPYQSTGTFDNLPVGNYSVKVKDAAGCVDSIAVALTQLFPDLQMSSAPTDATCSGNADGKVVFTVSGGKTPYQYSVNNGNSFQSSNTFNVKSGTYQLIAKDANGCTLNKTETVSLNNDLTIVAGNDVTICEGTSANLQAVSNAVSYVWSPSIALSNGTSASPKVSPTVTTKYYVTATKGICVKKDSLIVNVNPAPIADAGDDITICFGASTDLKASGGVSYTWSPATYLADVHDPQTHVNRPVEDIVYSLQVKDVNGCNSLKADQVKLKVTPAVRIFAGRDTSVAFNQPLQLHAVELGNSGVTSYTWSPAAGLSSINGASPVVRIDRDMLYTVTGKTPADCEGSDQIFIKAYKGPEIYVPTAFTPNNDGRNDLLRATAIGMKEYHYFTIYDRWGHIVFTTKDFNKGWDGKLKGVLQSPSGYIWIAETVDFRGNIVQRKGSTILLR